MNHRFFPPSPSAKKFLNALALLALLACGAAAAPPALPAQELIDFCPGACGSDARPYRVGDSLIVEAAVSAGAPPRLYRLDPSTLLFERLEARDRQLEVLRGNGRVLIVEDSFAPQRPLWAITEQAFEELPAGLAYGLAFSSSGELYFSDLLPGKEIWQSDGTAAGTRELFDLEPGWEQCHFPNPGCWPSPDAIVPSGGRVFFAVPQGYGYVPWVWAGEPGGPHPLPGIRRGTPIQALPGGRAIIYEDEPDALWVSDGSAAGSFRLLELPDGASVSFVTFLRGRLYFKTSVGPDFFASDLTPAGTGRLPADFGAAVPTMADTWRGIFLVHPTAGGFELGLSDGTPAGTRYFGPAASEPFLAVSTFFPLADGRVVFAAADAATGSEPWISDGTEEGTRRLADLAPGAASSSPDSFVQVGNRVFFQAAGPAKGRELWALDLPPLAPCGPDQVCLMGGRFEVEVTAQTADGPFPGRRVAGSADSGVFTFFSTDNWEMLVKVLDGCAINGHRWVFAAAATDAGYRLAVRDRESGAEKVYANTSGHPAVAVTDTEAFGCADP